MNTIRETPNESSKTEAVRGQYGTCPIIDASYSP